MNDILLVFFLFLYLVFAKVLTEGEVLCGGE